MGNPGLASIHTDVWQPCTTNCTGGGTGSTGSTSPYLLTVDGTTGKCYSSENYCEYYDTSGNLQSQTYLTAGSAGYSYKYVGPQNTVTGTQPSPFLIPDNTDYSYLGFILHADTSTGIVTATNPSNGAFAYSTVNSSAYLVLSSPNEPDGAASLKSLGYIFGVPTSCAWAVAKAAGVSLIAGAAAAAIVLGLCGLDGPAALFSCGFGWLLAGALVERASSAARQIVADGGC